MMRSAAPLPAALGLSVLLFLLSTAPALGQMGGDLRAGATHQDWQVLCEDTPAGETCFISQAAADDSGEPVMQIMVGRIEGDNVMVVYLPLGLDLRPGMLFRIGEDLQREFPFQTCLPNGCRVVAPVDPEMLAAMRAGTTFLIGVRPLESDQVAVIEGSLMGFSAGFQEVAE
ncbi:invasion associated locus B family protein [Thioalkalivibrio sp.]|uniref:invasion associated locus B family protein n=1 Tax=Thioalkalivibrio sp. TaxID=2093813 RepID=UPI0035632FC5